MFIALGLGHGLILMSLNFSVQAMADNPNVAYAAAMYTFARTFGMCIGVAVGGAAFQNELKNQLGELHLPTEVANVAESFIANLRTFPKTSAQYHNYILAYTNAFKLVFEVLTAIAGLAGIFGLLIKKYSMDKGLDSEHVLRLDSLENEPSKPESQS